jgi:hypothetical protein
MCLGKDLGKLGKSLGTQNPGEIMVRNPGSLPQSRVIAKMGWFIRASPKLI